MRRKLLPIILSAFLLGAPLLTASTAHADDMWWGQSHRSGRYNWNRYDCNDNRNVVNQYPNWNYPNYSYNNDARYPYPPQISHRRDLFADQQQPTSFAPGFGTRWNASPLEGVARGYRR